MATIYGREWTRRELLSRVGDISQIARVKLHRLGEGYEDGVLAADVMTGSGLQFTVLASRGLDVSSAAYRGIALAWRSAQSDRHPAFYEPQGLGWLRSFPGGLVTTCGLTWMGAPDVDDGVELGLHGRFSNTPATEVVARGCWQGDEYVLTVEGVVREAVVFGENVTLHRRITTSLGASNFTIRDTVRNEGFQTAPHMLLYHVNVGFPVVDAGSRVVVPAAETVPRDDEAAEGAEEWNVVHEPRAGYAEKVYFHTVRPSADGTATAAVVNPHLEGGIALYVQYRPEQLPHFVQWKMLGQGIYVIGLEPANALVMGRSKERAAGRLRYLEPGEERVYEVEIGVATEAAARALLG